jgi:hypothetical protein
VNCYDWVDAGTPSEAAGSLLRPISRGLELLSFHNSPGSPSESAARSRFRFFFFLSSYLSGVKTFHERRLRVLTTVWGPEKVLRHMEHSKWTTQKVDEVCG